MAALRDPKTGEEILPQQPFVTHLVELRDRVLRSVVAITILFLALFPFANTLYLFLAEPLMRHMPEGTSMIATEVASPFLTPFKLALIVAFFACIPYLLYQLWSFVAPGLYENERRIVWPLLFSSAALFYLGMAFAYYVVFPLVFAFLTSMAPEGVAVMTDINHYLNFVLKMFFAFGVAFEVPIATIILVAAGVTTPQSLAAKRPYIIVGAFVVGMLLTPPDIISQTLLALPMWLLFEIGLLLSKRFERKPEDANEAASADAGGAPTGADDDPEAYRPMTPEQMEAELERMEQESAGRESHKKGGDPTT